MVFSTEALKKQKLLLVYQLPVVICHKSIYLSNFWIEESYKSKGSEWLRYEDISDLAELGEIVTQVIGSHVLSTSADKHFARDLRIIPLLQK